MKKPVLPACVVLLLRLPACAKSIRYSRDERKDFLPAIAEPGIAK